MVLSRSGSARGKRTRSTIKDVAEAAEVSISTVSLVMNDKGHVSANTRTRVMETAQRLGYVPTQAARRLVTRRTGNIGFVVWEGHFTRSEPFYTRIFLGTEFEARHRNLYVLLTSIPEQYTAGVHTPRFMRERNVDGLLVAGKVDGAFLEEARRSDIPVLTIDFEGAGFPSVVIDNQQGARLATQHLIDRGHRRIAFMGTDMGHPSLRSRLEGYRLALAQAGIPHDEDLILTLTDEEPARPAGVELARRLVAVEPRPTAVFCVNDAMALGVLETVRHAGLRVPEDLAIVGFDDVTGAANSSPPLTTIRVFKEQLGELALRYLWDMIEAGIDAQSHFDRSQHAIKVSTELIQRGTT